MKSKLMKRFVHVFAMLIMLTQLFVPIIPAWQGLVQADELYISTDFTYNAAKNTVEGFSAAGSLKYASNSDHQLNIPAKSADNQTDVTAIGSHAFQNLTLQTLELPETLQTIHEYAFDRNALKTVNFNELANLTTIGEAAFRANQLKTVKLTSALTSIGNSAFANNELTKVEGANVAELTSVQHVADSAFEGNKLTEIAFGAELETIGSDVFNGNGQVVKVTTTTEHHISSTYTKGDGFVVNPLTITVDYVDQTGAIIDKTTLGADFTKGDKFYLKGETFTKAEIDALQKDIAGYTYLETTPANGFELTSSTSLTVHYIKNDAKPKLAATNLFYLTDPQAEITEAMVKTTITAKTAAGVAIPADNITISVDNGEFPLSRENEHVYTIQVSVVDDLGNKATSSIKVEVFTALLNKEIGNGWYYRDFAYSGRELIGFTQTGADKLLAGNGELVFPGVNPTTQQVLNNIRVPTTTDIAAGALAFNTAAYSPLMISMNFEQMTGLTGMADKAFVNLTNLERLSFKGLRNLTGFVGYGGGVPTVPFMSSPKLTSLDLTGCTAITNFGAQCFSQSKLDKIIGYETLTSVTTIGDAAFSASPFSDGFDFSLFPNLVSIGYGAFRYSQMPVIDFTACKNLTTLGGDINYDRGIFQDNTTVTRVDFSGLTKLNHIGAGMFKNATKLTSVNISNMPALTTINAGAFQKAPLTELAWSNSPKLKTIANLAFASLTFEELDFTMFPELTTIGMNAFESNLKLKRVDLSNLDKLTTIDSYAFRYAPLESLNLTNCSSLTVINPSAFDKAGLEQIAGIETIAKLTTFGNSAFYWSPFTAGFNFQALPNLQTIGQSAFYQAKFTELDLSNLKALTYIGYGAFFNAVNLTKVDLSGANLMTFSGASIFENAPIVDLDMTGCTGVRTFPSSIFKSAKLESITGMADLSAVTSFDASAFRNSPFTNGFNFQAFPNLTTIGIESFLNVKFQELDLSNLTKLATTGTNAFQNATNLTKVNMRGLRALTSIGNGVFYNAPIADLDVTGCVNITSIEANAFRSATGLTHITGISDLSKLSAIGRDAFYHASLDDRFDFRYFPNLTSIGWQAFYNDKFTVVDFSNSPKLATFEQLIFSNVVTLKKVSFNGCSALTTIIDGTFTNAPIEELDLTGTKLTSIGNNAFKAAKLKTIQGFDSQAALKTIGSDAFSSSPLEELDFTGVTELTTIGNNAFYSAKLTSVDLSNQQKMISIGTNAFYSSPLEWIKIGAINPTTGTATNKNIYNVNGTPTNYRISSKNTDVPVYLKGPGTSTILGGTNWGYHVIYDAIDVSYLDNDNHKIAPNTTLDAYNSLVVTPPQVFGYERSAATIEHNVPGSETKATGTVTLTEPGNLADYKADGLQFYYTPLPDATLAPYANNQLFFTPIKTAGKLDQKMSTKLTLTTSMKNAGLTNFKGIIEVRYDPSLIDPNSFTFTQENQYYTVANPADTPGVLKFVFTENYNNIVEGSTSMLAPTISFKLRNDGTVPYNAPIAMNAYLLDDQMMVNKADEIIIKGVYSHHNLSKTDNLNQHSINKGGLDELGLFTDTSDLAINYSFGFPLERNVESYELVDQLPTYKAYQVDGTGAPVVVDGVVQVATLRPHLSPASITAGWYYTDATGVVIAANADGTPTDAVNATQVRRVRGEGASQKLNTKEINPGTLTLIYPHIMPTGNANITNTAEITAVPVNTNGKFDDLSQSSDGHSYTEPVLASQAVVSTNVYSYEASVPAPVANTTKLYVDNFATFTGNNTRRDGDYRDNYLYDTTGDKAREQMWRVPFTIRDNTNKVQLEDATLKHELTTNAIGVIKYTKVDASEFSQPIVTAYGTDSTTPLYCSSGEKLVEFPAVIQAAIRYITITDVGISVKNTSVAKVAKISTALIDPASTHYQTPVLQNDNKYYTKASLTAVDTLTGTNYAQEKTVEDYYEIREAKVGVQVTDQLINKLGGSPVTEGNPPEVFKYDSVFYAVGMNVIDERTNKILTDAYLLDGETFNDVKVTIEMPKAINPLRFVKDSTLIRGTTNLAVQFTSDATNNQIILTADTMNPQVVKKLGEIEATVDIYANNQTTYTQQVYMEYNEATNEQNTVGAADNELIIDRIDTNVEQPTKNPAYPDDALYAKQALLVYATEGLSMAKYIRTQTTSGDFTAWNNDNQATLVRGDGTLEYRLAIANVTTADQELPTIVDVLPYGNDRSITSPTSRGTSALDGAQVKLTAPITLSSNDYDVEYLISPTNIDYYVEGQLVTADEYFDPSNDEKLGTIIANDRPHWVTADKVDFDYNPLMSGELEDASQVRAIRITPKAVATKLTGGSFVEATIAMQAPAYTATLMGAKIANSFAYKNAESANRFVESNAAMAEIEAPAAALKIQKIDARDEKPIQGVAFGLYDLAGTLLQQQTTDQNGFATFKDLSKIDYKLKELSTPAGYKPDTTAKAISADVFDTLTDGVFTNATPVVITNEE
ncbi:MAG: leucine-rich repeat protein, partial [Lactobacillaceae bacterium]|nr:leucine-rich repeat protein [Lactobacillaceae bacterium]